MKAESQVSLKINNQNTRRYTLLGALFGFLFPLLGTQVLLLKDGLAPSLAHIISLHQQNFLLQLIDTAPFFLGLFALLAGRRQDKAQEAGELLRLRETELQNTNQDLLKTRGAIELEVSERTAEIEIRTRQLEAVSTVARAVAAVQEIEILLPLVTEVVSNEFGFYHAGVFLIDDRREFALLQAANSQGGKRMLERGHRLGLGTSGIVGFVAGHGQPRIALDVEADSAFFNNPDLPLTRSEMALPLKAGQQIIGVLDVQSTEKDAFNQQELNVLSIVADQIAIAIDNARLFSQTRQALADTQAIYQQYVKSDWARYIEKLNNLGYMYDGIRAVALNRAPAANKSPNSIDVPIRVRGQLIGNVSIRPNNSQRRLSTSEISIAQAAADRAALAIENARLLTDAQRRAAKERSIAEISSKVGTSIKLENIMQVAVEELGRTLPGAEVILHLGDSKDSNGAAGTSGVRK